MTCIRSEALTTAMFTGPMGWIDLSIGTWQRLYTLLHERSKSYSEQDVGHADSKLLQQMLSWDIQSEADEETDMSDEADTMNIIVEENEDEENANQTRERKQEDRKRSKRKKGSVYKSKFRKLKLRMQQYFNDQHQEEKKWKLLRSLQEDFDQYQDLLMLAYEKVQQNSIHPKIFGLGLSGALMKTMGTAMFTTLFAVIRFVFFG